MLSLLLTIAVLHWLVLITPGVNMLLISQLAASGQRRAAGFAALGVSSVALTWSVLAVLGVGAVFNMYPGFRQAVQLAGALYLLYVGARLWRASTSIAASTRQHYSPFAAFRMGFLTNIMNPKSALFFGSVFATALPEAPSAVAMTAAVLLSVGNTFCWHIFLALAFSHPRVQAAYSRQSQLLNRVAGALVGVFGARLLAGTVAEIRGR